MFETPMEIILYLLAGLLVITIMSCLLFWESIFKAKPRLSINQGSNKCFKLSKILRIKRRARQKITRNAQRYQDHYNFCPEKINKPDDRTTDRQPK